MVARVPILGQDHVGEFGGQPVHGRNDQVTLWHGERAARAEVVLDVHDDERLELARVIRLHMRSIAHTQGRVREAARVADKLYR